MEKIDQLQKLHRILLARKQPVSKRFLAEQLECTEKSVSRYINILRDMCLAPIEYEPQQGWHYDRNQQDQIHLPGLWLTSSDIQSLLLLLSLLKQFDQGILSEELNAINECIDQLLENRKINRSDLESRIRILPIGNRTLADQQLIQVFTSLIDKSQLWIEYRSYTGEVTNRHISPQRLIYYRDNWYVDAWCHDKEDLRSFSLARIKELKATKKNAQSIKEEQLQAHLSPGYGLFAGPADNQAILKFSPPIAQDISMQQWHPLQESHWENDQLILKFPYSHDPELVQDILRFCPYVYVEAPMQLRENVKRRLLAAVEIYAD